MCKNELNTVEKKSTNLWHRKLGHISENGPQILRKNNFIPSIKGTHLNHCVDCLVDKQHRVSFHINLPHRKSDVLELVQSNVCGPMKVKTLDGASYFVTFIGDAI